MRRDRSQAETPSPSLSLGRDKPDAKSAEKYSVSVVLLAPDSDSQIVACCGCC